MTKTLIASTVQFLQGGGATPLQWLWLVVPLLALGAAGVWLVATGDATQRRGASALVARAASSLRRVNALPAWASGGIAVTMWALFVAVIGFVWDVAYHIDYGRDQALFTPSHTMIITGLLGIGLAGLVSITIASVERADTTLRLGRLRLPVSAVALCLLSGGAGLGFPLDDLWHRAYGIDVSMWGPTHLLMIGGASLAPIAAWLMYAEAGGPKLRGRGQAHLRHNLAVAMVLGLSTFQLEFDLGVPQWQALYHPVLVAFAASVALTCARAALGSGGALKAAGGFLVARAAIALVVGNAIGLSTPHFPLYLGVAIAVEAAFFFGRALPVPTRALLAGVLAGTLGMASEWGFAHVFGRQPWQASLLPGMWVAAGVGISGAIVGLAMGRVLSAKPAAVSRGVLALALVATIGFLAVPLPRRGVEATATIRTSAASARVPAVDRYRQASFLQHVDVTVSMTPSDAARDADWFVIQSWQGGGLQTTPLEEVSPGTYRATRAVPTGGSWKTIVLLQKNSIFAAAPIWMPADPEYKLPAIGVQPVRTAAMLPASELLIREAHAGPSLPARIAYTGLAGTTATWIAVLIAGFVLVRRREARRVVAPDDAADTRALVRQG